MLIVSEEVLEDMADIDLTAPVPGDWEVEEDDSVFEPRDKDDDADG